MKNLFSNTKLVLALFMSVALFSTSCNKDDDEPKPQEVFFEIDGEKIDIPNSMYWYTSPMGGDPYLRLKLPRDGQDNPDLFKLYLSTGVSGDIVGTFSWDGGDAPSGTYNHGYTANNEGFNYDWTSIGKTGSGTITVKKEGDKYSIVGSMILSVGSYDWSTGVFTETSTKDIKISYNDVLIENL